MFDNIMKIFKKFAKDEKKDSKVVAKERLHLVLMQDRANVSADFMELMKQEIIEVIKKYIDVDENSIDVKLTNKVNSDGTTGAPILYANIPIINVKDDTKQINVEGNLEDEVNGKGAKDEQVFNKEKKEKQTKCTKKEKNSKKDKNVENKIESKENVEESKSQELEQQKKMDEIAFNENASEKSEVEHKQTEKTEKELEKSNTKEE